MTTAAEKAILFVIILALVFAGLFFWSAMYAIGGDACAPRTAKRSTNAVQQQRIAEAKEEWHKRQLAGHTEDFNRMLYPIAQAEVRK